MKCLIALEYIVVCFNNVQYKHKTHLPCDMSINQSYLINFIVNFIAFLRLPIVFNLDTIVLFYVDCRLLVTFANSKIDFQAQVWTCMTTVTKI